MPDVLHAGWIGVLGGPSFWTQAPAGAYVEELLAQAGVLNWRWLESADELADPAVRLAVVANGRMLDELSASALRRFIEAGGHALVLGRPGPLAGLFAVQPQPPVRDGWLLRSDRAAGRFADVCPVPLHVFDVVHLLAGGERFEPGPINFSIGNHQVNWPISAWASVGRGRALLVAADLVGSIVRIQQGLAVHRDGLPAPDGSANVNDGVLKCDDSIMLDWSRDRQQVAADACPIFVQPQCDLLRELLVAALLELADAAGLAAPMLAVWPRGLPAVGLISHDSDGNEPQDLRGQIDLDAQADVTATWCVMAGTDDGAVSEYLPEMIARIAASGHELGLHYDAQTDHRTCRWGREALRDQLSRVRARVRSAGIDAPIYSNKNHFMRWEGRLDFFRWLMREGVRVDQSKASGKPGAAGWPFGSCHPWRPIDDEVQPPQLMDLLQIGFAVLDPGSRRLMAAFARPCIDSAVARGGVVHLLFHPNRASEPEVSRNLLDLVAYGRGKGLEWWTSRRIGRWQFARRAVRLNGFRVVSGRASLKLEVPQGLEGAVIRVAGGSVQADLSGPTDLECELG